MVGYGFEDLQAGKREFSQRFRRYVDVAEAEIESIGTKLAGPENIVGVATEYKVSQGQLTGQPCIKVYVVEKLDRDLIEPDYFVSPDAVKGLPTDVEAVGEIVAELDPRCYLELEGGISVGHLAITAGTLGYFVRKAGDTRRLFVLSNNHVLANCNRCEAGEFVVQPGPKDGGNHAEDQHPGSCGSLDTCVGALADWHTIDPSKDNEIDAAIAEVLWRPWQPRIRHLGTVNGVERAQRNTKVVKVGRTTGLTHGTIVADDADIRVRYRDRQGRTLFLAWFVDQIAVRGDYGPFSRGGDSGSTYLDENNKIIGLHFAAGNGRSFGNHIDQVFQKLGIDLAY